MRRGEIDVAIAFSALSALAEIPKLMAAPINNAATLAFISCVVTLALTWWTLRYGRSLGCART